MTKPYAQDATRVQRYMPPQEAPRQRGEIVQGPAPDSDFWKTPLKDVNQNYNTNQNVIEVMDRAVSPGYMVADALGEEGVVREALGLIGPAELAKMGLTASMIPVAIMRKIEKGKLLHPEELKVLAELSKVEVAPGTAVLPGEFMADRPFFHASRANIKPDDYIRSGTDPKVTNRTGYGGQQYGAGAYYDDNPFTNINNLHSIMQASGPQKGYQYIAQLNPSVAEGDFVNTSAKAQELAKEMPRYFEDLHRGAGSPELQVTSQPLSEREIEYYVRNGYSPKQIEALNTPKVTQLSVTDLTRGYMNNLRGQNSKEYSQEALRNLQQTHGIGGSFRPSTTSGLSLADFANEYQMASPENYMLLGRIPMTAGDVDEVRNSTIRYLADK
jgi:hypothetical protein